MYNVPKKGIVLNPGLPFIKTKVHYYKDDSNAFKWMLHVTLEQISPTLGILHVIYI
jgi:hypothetical protein